MGSSHNYNYLAIAALVVIAILFMLTRRKKPRNLILLGGIALAFVIAGGAFGDTRVVGYGLMDAGFIVAIIDIIKQRNRLPQTPPVNQIS